MTAVTLLQLATLDEVDVAYFGFQTAVSLKPRPHCGDIVVDFGDRSTTRPVVQCGQGFNQFSVLPNVWNN